MTTIGQKKSSVFVAARGGLGICGGVKQETNLCVCDRSDPFCVSLVCVPLTTRLTSNRLESFSVTKIITFCIWNKL